MTQAELIPLNDGIIFNCHGHAEYAPKGKDIVCAGISALCMALIGRLQELDDENIINIRHVNISDGNVDIEINYTDDHYSELIADNVFMTVMNGLEAIEKLYPDNLIVNQLLTDEWEIPLNSPSPQMIYDTSERR